MPPHNGQQPPRCNHLAWRVLATALLYALAYLRRGEGVRLGTEGAQLKARGSPPWRGCAPSSPPLKRSRAWRSVCCCSSVAVDLVAVGSRVGCVGGCCGCLNGGEVVRGGARCCALVWLDICSGRRGCGVGLLSCRKNKI